RTRSRRSRLRYANRWSKPPSLPRRVANPSQANSGPTFITDRAKGRMGRVVHFDIQTSNPQATIAFYSGLFGWEFQPFGPPDFYWLITTGPEGTPGINGGMVRRRGG